MPYQRIKFYQTGSFTAGNAPAVATGVAAALKATGRSDMGRRPGRRRRHGGHRHGLPVWHVRAERRRALHLLTCATWSTRRPGRWTSTGPVTCTSWCRARSAGAARPPTRSRSPGSQSSRPCSPSSRPSPARWSARPDPPPGARHRLPAPAGPLRAPVPPRGADGRHRADRGLGRPQRLPIRAASGLSGTYAAALSRGKASRCAGCPRSRTPTRPCSTACPA